MKTPSGSLPPRRTTNDRVDDAELMIDRVLDLESRGRHDEAAAVACAGCERDPAAAKRLDDTIRVLSLLKSPASDSGRDLTREIIERVERHRVYLPRAPRRRPSVWRSAAAACGLTAIAVLGVMRYRSPEPLSATTDDAAALSISQPMTLARNAEPATPAIRERPLTASLFTPSLPAATPYEGRSRQASLPSARLTPWIDGAEARVWAQGRTAIGVTRAVAPSPLWCATQGSAMTWGRDDSSESGGETTPRAMPEWTWLIELTKRP
jgi:hypothetical protein